MGDGGRHVVGSGSSCRIKLCSSSWRRISLRSCLCLTSAISYLHAPGARRPHAFLGALGSDGPSPSVGNAVLAPLSALVPDSSFFLAAASAASATSAAAAANSTNASLRRRTAGEAVGDVAPSASSLASVALEGVGAGRVTAWRSTSSRLELCSSGGGKEPGADVRRDDDDDDDDAEEDGAAFSVGTGPSPPLTDFAPTFVASAPHSTSAT